MGDVAKANELERRLIDFAVRDGSWGNAVNTGFAILTLGVPYRYLPIYQK